MRGQHLCSNMLTSVCCRFAALQCLGEVFCCVFQVCPCAGPGSLGMNLSFVKQ